MDYKKLDELNKLRQSGALTEEEFENEKQKLFSENETCNSSPNNEIPFGLQENSYLALMSFLILVPYVGWIIPIVLWVMGKNFSEQINKQGKYILNWYITWFIFGIISTIVLLAVLPGVIINGYGSPLGIFGSIFWLLPLTAIIGIICLVFPIIGGIKGLNGQVWKYPLSIPFLK
ncbi:DUF4870 domain-containing protein [Bacteroides sp.]|uniref:DUF4870 domain-containing protein n=1 Tax=Bacteroides sp. TaxID=29523 RepID=UPI002636EF62|nr:DUF4870 domain-containing protein [Bacteroides sp.]MDD3039195.1 DUF4870 domain-containing protein [Bacteroides sp.]